MASKDLVKPDEINSSLVLDALSGAVDPSKIVFSDSDPTEAAKRIALADLNATSKEELLGTGVVSGKNFVDQPFELTSVEWQRGEFETDDGVSFYAILHGTTQMGKKITVACGATAVMRKAAKLAVEGWLPAWVRITKGKTNEKGYTPLSLSDASDAAPFGA